MTVEEPELPPADGATAIPAPDDPPVDIDDVVGTPQDEHAAEVDLKAPRTVNYDPTRDREKVRGRVVYGLVALLGFLIVGPMIAIWNGESYETMQPFPALVFGSV